MLVFFNQEPNTGVATVYGSYITFNKPLVVHFEDAYRVRVAVDKDNGRVIFYKVSKDYALSGELDEGSLLKVGITKTYARICSKQLLDFICQAFNLKIVNKEFKRFSAFYSEDDKAVIVEMGGDD